MIKKYRIGNPIETDSVVKEIAIEQQGIPYFETIEAEKTLKMSMGKTDRVFGLGETIRGINKRGYIYTSNCSDDPNHTEDKRSLYAAQNFFVFWGAAQKFGMYVDTPGIVSFDIGYEEINTFSICFEDFDAYIYVVEGDSILDIVKQFRGIIGRSYIPPKWAFGLGQSRWSYMNEQEVREVVDNYDALGMPLDSVYLDIDYMERYKDFTVDEERFPDFEGFVKEMRARDIHLVPIIDAGVKIEDGYDVYEEGVEKGYFCKKENGERLVAAVWPGKVHFPDVLNEEARKWFGEKYKILLDMGIDGFWND
nr:alpha-glucosidase [Acetatifactor sp.]